MFLYPYNAWINCKTFLFCAEKRGLTMNIYTTDKIRNVVLLGHGGAGKTSLVEAMAYLLENGVELENGEQITRYEKRELDSGRKSVMDSLSRDSPLARAAIISLLNSS